MCTHPPRNPAHDNDLYSLYMYNSNRIYNKQLKLSKQTNYASNKAKSARALVYPVINSRSNFSINTKLYVYKTNSDMRSNGLDSIHISLQPEDPGNSPSNNPQTNSASICK